MRCGPERVDEMDVVGFGYGHETCRNARSVLDVDVF
jgi:hypothetical protein